MNDIILKPNFLYWLIKNVHILCIAIIVILLNNLAQTNGKEYYINYIAFVFAIGLLCVVFYQYISTLLCTEWIITTEQIKIYKGVFTKSTGYIELYRVFDYEEKQSFFQSLINNTNIFIYSGDKSTPVLELEGIKNGSAVVQEIRERVEIQKARKGIYEFTNR